MLDSWQRLTFYPLKWISLGGLHPESNSKWRGLQFGVNFSYFGLLIVLATVETLLSVRRNVFNTIESILTVILYLHIITKYTVLYKHRATLRHLLSQRSKFWKIQEFQGGVGQKCNELMITVLRNTKWYLGYSLLVVSSFSIKPFVTKELPVFIYVPPGWFYFLFCSFYAITPAIMSSIWGVDTIFYTLSMPVGIQLKLLASKFENLKTLKQVKKLVDYHSFLIWYSQTINDMFSGIFLTQFLVAIATSCIQLFIASQPKFSLMTKITSLSYFTMQIVETALYCLTTDLISESFADVGDAVYGSKWYYFGDDLKKSVTLVISRSQKGVVFSGLGLVWINKETFTKIFQTALSFYTYLNTIVYND